jgi:ABC-type lipoprotein release transport system permease subunit
MLPWLVGATLAAAALVASWIPARRATRIQPIDVMRVE